MTLESKVDFFFFFLKDERFYSESTLKKITTFHLHTHARAHTHGPQLADGAWGFETTNLTLSLTLSFLDHFFGCCFFSTNLAQIKDFCRDGV